jgi:hypothetical protein
MAAAALTTSATSADAQKGEKGGHAAVSRGGSPGGGAPRAGGNFRSSGSVGMSGGNFRSGASPQFRSGQVNRQFNGGQISRQFSGQARSSQAFSGQIHNGQIHNGNRRHVARRHFRGGPGIYAYGSGYSDYGYESYPYAEDDDCYETQRVWRYGTWRYVRVYVCE